MPYKLAATLAGHSSDVRGVASPSSGLVLSASRDTTAIAWTRPDSSSPFAQSVTYPAGTRYVNAITYIPESQDAPHGYLVAGGQDTIINVFIIGSDKVEPAFSLLGHKENVCALDATASGTIISGSWDKTARVWSGFAPEFELRGHTQAVWAVVAINDTEFLTGSADRTVKLWHTHKEVRTFSGHKDAVRSLALIPDIGFVSCSNDSDIRVWTMAGDTIHILSGHTSFVYTLAVLPSGEIVSGGEDRTVRVWKDGECSQTIVHPAISVWAVSAMPNGDIVSGCSDGVVRVFSQSEERWASAEELKTYDASVASQALPSQQVGDVKKSDLPGADALAQSGKKEGEVKMIRNGDIVEAHQWSNASSSWQKIGEVVDAIGSGRKQLYQGKEYDFVFDVDVKEGAPPLKLPYNATENPYQAAQRFLAANDLPAEYLDQVVQFIEKNAAGPQLGPAPTGYVDPYTGASRYVSSPSSVPAAGAPSSFVDPFTGGSSYTSAPASNPPPPAKLPPKISIIPVRIPLAFKQANVGAMRARFDQLNDVLSAHPTTVQLAMAPSEKKGLHRTFDFLATATARPSLSPAAKQLTWNDVDNTLQIMARWPPSQRFPVIDLARLIAAHSPAVLATPTASSTFYEAIMAASEFTPPWSTPLPKYRETNILLCLRALANMFQIAANGTVTGVGPWTQKLYGQLSRVTLSSLNNTQLAAYTTILLNGSCIAMASNVEPHIRQLQLDLILNILGCNTADSESLYRALVGLGNFLYVGKSELEYDPEQVNNLVNAVLEKERSEERFQNVVAEIRVILA
ncbi:hypothetical protein BOTBODRAFT_27194 [Botryobasidium botryosum FD-172 SS1]|uniref:Phospholipase A-2-activating protein n=1 Tax=Botryobasidium botryosum (strain FD-172 SS1) TaxID=930990 RepID=A0A067N7L9_BOTB1|nr:hypothetical protein BOTBODRAFT_27194 [Botryobasidium botryosum FD-172 SS1]